MTTLNQTIADLAPHIADQLEQYATSILSNVRVRDHARGYIFGYLRASHSAGSLLESDLDLLIETIRKPDGQEVLAACFPKPKAGVTAGERSFYNWRNGNPLGSFERNLWNLISIADSNNLAAIEQSFPSHVEAYRRFAHETGYWDALVERIGK